MASVGESLRNTSEGIDAILEVFKELACPKVAIKSKPLLNLGQAQRFSGLSRQFLLEAIKDDRLKGAMLGRAWRVRRRDLERFISKLF